MPRCWPSNRTGCWAVQGLCAGCVRSGGDPAVPLPLCSCGLSSLARQSGPRGPWRLLLVAACPLQATPNRAALRRGLAACRSHGRFPAWRAAARSYFGSGTSWWHVCHRVNVSVCVRSSYVVRHWAKPQIAVLLQECGRAVCGARSRDLLPSRTARVLCVHDSVAGDCFGSFKSARGRGRW